MGGKGKKEQGEVYQKGSDPLPAFGLAEDILAPGVFQEEGTLDKLTKD